MASDPPEDDIANFVSFTSTTREQAINFLKVTDVLVFCYRLEVNISI
jgi:hypothetical protein